MLRVLHDITGRVDRPRLVEAAAALRDAPGCVSAEVYASMIGDDHTALTMVFERESDYWSAWSNAPQAYADLHDVLTDDDLCVTEFSLVTSFGIADGVWAPADADRDARRIFWPARGEIRIAIQYAVEPNDEMRALVRPEVIETRREPGCLQYDWMESLELPEHLLLLEIWSDQVIYDRHAQKRVDTAAFRGDSKRRRTEPQRGITSLEFTRRQTFQLQYDRWMPADVADYSASIHWPAS